MERLRILAKCGRSLMIWVTEKAKNNDRGFHK